jgi:predicted ABC-type ATPase
VPTLVIVAGPNGSGKSTLVRTGALSELLDVPTISINADDIARMFATGGQPSNDQSLYAAQVSDALLDDQIVAGRSVIIETVLSSDKYKSRVVSARAAGFQVVLVYVSVRIAELNVARVANRLIQGGHDVPADRIIARRSRSHEMFAWFAKEADQVFVFDNSTTSPAIVAFKDRAEWTMLDLAGLSADLAATIVKLAGA